MSNYLKYILNESVSIIVTVKLSVSLYVVKYPFITTLLQIEI